MRQERIEIGKFYRITYNATNERELRIQTNSLPPHGEIIKVINIRDRRYTFPIRVIVIDGNSYICHSSDLNPLYYEKENLEDKFE